MVHPMSGMATGPAVNVRKLILDALQQQQAYRPSELLRVLMLKSADVTEGQLKDELAALLTEGVLELSSDRHIILRQRQQAAS
jgi:hypothetical protein